MRRGMNAQAPGSSSAACSRALLLAGVVSNFASGHPDGLDSVAREGCTFDAAGNITGGTCMAQSETGNQTEDSPLAGYGLRGVGNEFLSTGLSGVIGVRRHLRASGGGVFWLLRAGREDRKKQTA